MQSCDQAAQLSLCMSVKLGLLLVMVLFIQCKLVTVLAVLFAMFGLLPFRCQYQCN